MFSSTVSMAHNIVKSGAPRNIHSTLVTQYPYRTRQATKGDIRSIVNPDNHISTKTFKYQARIWYNQLPTNLHQMEKKRFKSELKKWVKEHIPIR